MRVLIRLVYIGLIFKSYIVGEDTHIDNEEDNLLTIKEDMLSNDIGDVQKLIDEELSRKRRDLDMDKEIDSVNLFKKESEKIPKQDVKKLIDEENVVNLGENVGYAEGLNYNRELLSIEHSRVRRSLSPEEETLRFQFNALDRDFKLQLKRDSRILHRTYQGPDLKEYLYSGKLEDEPTSKVNGFVYDNTFEGRIYIDGKTVFVVESVYPHRAHMNYKKYHSVIYKASDIKPLPLDSCKSVYGHAYDDVEQPTTATGKKSVVNGTDNEGIQHSRKRRNTQVWDPLFKSRMYFRTNSKYSENMYCIFWMPLLTHLMADYTYVAHFESLSQAYLKMTNHLTSIKPIYEGTDFNLDGTAEGITFSIAKLSHIRDANTCDNQECQFSNAAATSTPYDFIDLYSQFDHSAYCLSYIFMKRDFNSNAIGLAYTGSTVYAGGICENGLNFINKGQRFTNTGLVTVVNGGTLENPGTVLPDGVIDMVLAHEIGHNFGSGHDDVICTPLYNPNGHNLMWPFPSDGSKLNNRLFSDCSKHSIWPILLYKSGCFQVKTIESSSINISPSTSVMNTAPLTAGFSSAIPQPSTNMLLPSSNINPPSSNMPPPSSQIPLPTSNMPPPSSQMTLSSSNISSPSSNMPPPSSQMPLPSSNMPPPSSSMLPPSSQMPLPSSNVSPPSSNMLPPSSQIPLPTSIMPLPSSQMLPPSSNMPPPSLIMPPLSSQMPSPSSQMPLPFSNMPPPSSNIPPPSSQMPLPFSNMPPPSSNIPPPSSQMPPLSSQMPLPSSQMPPASSNMPPPSSQIPLPSSNMSPPSSKMPPPSSKIPPPSSQMLPLSSQMPLPSSQMPPPSSNMPPPSSQIPLPSSNMPPPSSKMPPPSSNIPWPSSIMIPMSSIIEPSPSSSKVLAPSSSIFIDFFTPKALLLKDSCVTAHNTRRLLYADTPNLEWNDDLASQAVNRINIIKDDITAARPNENFYKVSATEKKNCENACENWYSQRKSFENKNGNSEEYQRMVCYRYTRMGGASLTYTNSEDNLKSITVILVIYDGDDTSLTSSCVNERKGKQGPGGLELPGEEKEVRPQPKPPTKAKSVTIAIPLVITQVIQTPTLIIRYIEIYVIKLKIRGLLPSKSPSQYSKQELALGVDGIRLVARILIVENRAIDAFTIGGSGGSSRKRRALENTGDPDNSDLEDDAQYSVFVTASTNDGITVSSSWSDAITTLPAGVPPGVLCEVEKSCACQNVGEVNSTILAEVQYYGVNNSAVNESLTSIGKWDAQSVQLLCKEAKCNETALNTAETDISTNINATIDYINLANTARNNLRQSIDCALNNGTRSDLFDQYEALYNRIVYLTTTRDDLSIKKTLIEKERVRCSSRSWLRSVLENIWHKG